MENFIEKYRACAVHYQTLEVCPSLDVFPNIEFETGGGAVANQQRFSVPRPEKVRYCGCHTEGSRKTAK